MKFNGHTIPDPYEDKPISSEAIGHNKYIRYYNLTPGKLYDIYYVEYKKYGTDEATVSLVGEGFEYLYMTEYNMFFKNKLGRIESFLRHNKTYEIKEFRGDR